MNLAHSIVSARERIERSLERSGRADTVTLELAVKTQSALVCAQAAQALADAGLPAILGHNRVQEARATNDAIRQVPTARVHLIGALQTNKVGHALATCDLIETVDRLDLVDKLALRAHGLLPVFVQVNVSGEESKHGCSPADVPQIVEAIELAPHVRLDGLMTVGLNSPSELAVRSGYALLRSIRDDLAERLSVPESDLALSMGMSADMEWAIAEGATIVRLGSAIFGPRTP